MSGATVVAGLVAPMAVVVALAPRGALDRHRFRRLRPGVLPGARLAPGRRRASSTGSVGASLGAAVGTPAEVVGRLVRRLAGRPSDPSADRRAGTALLVGAVGVVVGAPLVAVPVVVACWAVPSLRRRSANAVAERAVRTSVPDAVDLFRLAIGAGLSVHQAVDAVAHHAPEPVAGALRETRRRVELGARLGDALDALADLGDPALPLAAALRGAARYGAPLGPSLDRVAVDARVLRRRRAEEDARRLPVQLLFPLVLCVLPAFGLLAVVPLLLASLQSLQL